VVLPTGAGKTVVFAHLTAWWRANHRSRVLVLAHRDELVNQAAEKLQAIAPHLSVGIVKGARNEVNRDVIVASVQTLRSAEP
jgi:superfamily II DNA or RNA helicase